MTAAPRTVRCPRCQAPIAGDYKFCPTCAFRLRAGGDEEAAPRAVRSPWKSAFFALGTLAALLACVFVGIFLFQPSWLLRQDASPPPPAPREWASLTSPALGVDRIPQDLIELQPGLAYRVALDSVADPGDVDLPALHQRMPELEYVDAYIWYPLRVMKYEVTRGQYEEFLRDLEAHPERVPASWRDAKKPAAEVDLLRHVPYDWRGKDERGKVTREWSVPDVDRNLPVSQVSAIDAQGFGEWASARFGIELRLPYAMEWVRAARGGQLKARWPWGEDQLIYACNNQASFGRPQFVHFVYPEPPTLGGATPEGLFAMAGNVAEWALDHDFRLQRQMLDQAPTVIWKRYEVPPSTVFACGGSFRNGIDDCQVESYAQYDYWNGRDDVGFRLVAFTKD